MRRFLSFEHVSNFKKGWLTGMRVSTPQKGSVAVVSSGYFPKKEKVAKRQSYILMHVIRI